MHIPKDDALIDEDRDKIVITTDTYTNRLINQILKSGEFNSVSALIRAAVQFFAYHRLTLERSYASLHPRDWKVQQEIDAQLAQVMPLLEESDTVLVDRGPSTKVVQKPKMLLVGDDSPLSSDDKEQHSGFESDEWDAHMASSIHNYSNAIERL